MEVKVRAALVALSLVLLSACGGSSGDSDFEGVWRGTYIPDGSTPVPIFAVARHGGTAFFYDRDGFTFVIPHFAGPGDIHQGGQVFPIRGFVFNDGSRSLSIDLKASVSANQITGSFTIEGDVLQLALKGTRPFSGDPSVVSGTWEGVLMGPDSTVIDYTTGAPIQVAVAPDGTFKGTDNACNVSGTITPALSGDNLFDVSFNETSYRGFAHCSGAMTGLAYESDTDDADYFGHASGIYYYLVVSNKNGALALEMRAK